VPFHNLGGREKRRGAPYLSDFSPGCGGRFNPRWVPPFRREVYANRRLPAVASFGDNSFPRENLSLPPSPPPSRRRKGREIAAGKRKTVIKTFGNPISPSLVRDRAYAKRSDDSRFRFRGKHRDTFKGDAGIWTKHSVM